MLKTITVTETTPEVVAKHPGMCGDQTELYTMCSCPSKVARELERIISHCKQITLMYLVGFYDGFH